MYSVILIIFLTTFSNGNGEFVKCIAQCIQLKDCEEAQLIFKEKGVNPQICGFNGTEPKVCCSENDEKTLFAFHYGGLRKAEKKPPSLVLMGSYRTTSNETKPIRILKVIPHPNYDNKTYLNDIAIIILAEDSREQPACLFTQRLNLRHDSRTITVGFGQTSFAGPFTKELIQVYMNIINKKSCEEEYKTPSITDSQLCVLGQTRYYENGISGVQDTCQGDSGGPLVLNREKNYVVGIVSNGRPCGFEAPGIYTYIAPYTSWIKSIILLEGNGKELQECNKLEPPYRTLSTCNRDGITGIACNSIAYIGERSKLAGYNFMAELGYGNIKNPEYKCDGFFVDHNIVITAAQCANINGDLPLVVRTIYYYLFEIKTQIINVAKVIPHPNYQSQTYLNDIAIVFLVKKSNILTNQYACLYTPSLKFRSVNEAFAFSYGTTSFDGPLLNDLLVVPMNIVNKSICEEQYKSKPLVESQLCGIIHTDYVAEDTYQGNSGGPIILKHLSTSTGITTLVDKEKVIEPFYIIGIVSYGQGPGVFTNITSHLDWIESIVWPKGTDKDRLYVA